MSYLNDLNSPHANIRARAEKVITQLTNGDYTVEDGVLRNCIGRVPPSDIIDLAVYAGIEFDGAATAIAGSRDTAAFIADYKRGRAAMSPEQKAEEAYERRAAFGPGVKTVNILTGERNIS